MTYELPTTREMAARLDQTDPLASTAKHFCLPDGLIYLDGHSLGPSSGLALSALERAAHTEWTKGLIRSWNEADWINLPRTVGAKLARLIGVPPGDVIVCDSVSINLYKLASAALEQASVKTIMVEADEFPTDQYMAQGLCEQTGAEFVRLPSGEGAAALERGGVLLKSVVNYRTAVIEDIETLETLAARHGSTIIWDLSHATGCVNLELAASGVRLATGCTYKYLNGGPGAPAFIYAQKSLRSVCVIRCPVGLVMPIRLPLMPTIARLAGSHDLLLELRAFCLCARWMARSTPLKGFQPRLLAPRRKPSETFASGGQSRSACPLFHLIWVLHAADMLAFCIRMVMRSSRRLSRGTSFRTFAPPMRCGLGFRRFMSASWRSGTPCWLCRIS